MMKHLNQPSILIFPCHILCRSTNVQVQKISVPTPRILTENFMGLGVSLAKFLKGKYKALLENAERRSRSTNLSKSYLLQV